MGAQIEVACGASKPMLRCHFSQHIQRFNLPLVREILLVNVLNYEQVEHRALEQVPECVEWVRPLARPDTWRIVAAGRRYDASTASRTPGGARAQSDGSRSGPGYSTQYNGAMGAWRARDAPSGAGGLCARPPRGPTCR